MNPQNHKSQGKVIKSAREIRDYLQNIKIWLTAPFSRISVKKQWENILQVNQDNICQAGILYPDKISFKDEEQIKIF